jgi:lipopolysaccharide biosynthesis glycosyltransferase
MMQDQNRGGLVRPLPPIVFAIDDGYARPLCVALRSLAAANRGHLADLQVIVLHESLSDSSMRLLEFHTADVELEVEVRRVDIDSARFPLWGWVTPASYLRLIMTNVLPGHDKAVYLDADILVLGDLLPLLHTELGDAPIAAVQDPLLPTLNCGLALPGWKDRGIEGDREYFNSGVTVFNLRACREQGTLDRAVWLLENEAEHILFHDQDAMNWAVDDKWIRLDRCWNTFPVSAIVEMFGPLPCEKEMLPRDVLIADESRARIMHYAGPNKPWGDQFPDCPARARYTDVLREVEHARLHFT